MQLLRAILTPLVAAAVLATAAPLVQAQNRGDDTLLEMHQAFRKGDRKKLEQQMEVYLKNLQGQEYKLVPVGPEIPPEPTPPPQKPQLGKLD